MDKNSRLKIWTAVALGVAVRLFFLFVSKDNGGYLGGDAGRYLLQAGQWLEGTIPFGGLYPVGYPAYLAFFIKAFHSIFVSALFCVILFALFTLWLARRANVSAAWLTALDPVGAAFGVIVGADFLGSILFCFLFVKSVEARAAGHFGLWRWGLLSVGFLSAPRLNPWYLFVPPLLLIFIWGAPPKRTSSIKAGFIFITVWLLLTAGYVGARYHQTNSASFSGHNSVLVGRYIVGSLFVGEGKSQDLYAAMDMASNELFAKQKKEPNYGWPRFIKDEIFTYPGIFSRLFVTSAVKTVFGHANAPIARFFSGKDIEGPGLWIGFSRGVGLKERLGSISPLWILGILANFALHAFIFFAGIRGLISLVRQGEKSLAVSTALILAYFTFSPVVFGEPRYFLQGTLVLVYLMRYRFKEEAPSSLS